MKKNWLLNIFKPKPNYLEALVLELKQDKDRLLLEVERLKEDKKRLLSELDILKQQTEIKEEIKIKPLTKQELRITECYEMNKPETLNKLAELTKIKKSSLSVYLSKIRKKGIKINFK